MLISPPPVEYDPDLTTTAAIVAPEALDANTSPAVTTTMTVQDGAKAAPAPGRFGLPEIPARRSTFNTIDDLSSKLTSSIPAAEKTPPGRNLNQIVTFSSRLVDNMADVVDALDISASSSIKYGTIKGSGR